MKEFRFGKDTFHLNDQRYKWLLDNFGEGGWYKGAIQDGKRWAWDSAFGNTHYYFANEKDATMFLLRWC